MKDMNNKNTTYSGGISASSLLGVAFVILKLCNIINWSWWWVTVPFWGPAVILLVVIAAIILVPLGLAGTYMLAAAVLEFFHKLRK